MNIQDPVKTIMSEKLITLHPKDKIKQAKDIFDKFPIHHLPIVVMNKVVGMLSLGDILFLSKKPIMHSFDIFIRDKKLSLDAVEEIMTSDVITTSPEASINEVLEIMVLNRVNALPVIKDGNLVGLVTTFDIMKTLIEWDK